MNNDIEEIINLYDEFFIIDTQEQITTEATVPVVKTVEVTASSEAVINKSEEALPHLPETASPSQISIAPLTFSGANKKHITVIYNDKNNDSRENVEMLSNLITKALKLSMDDVAIVRLSKNPEYSLSAVFDTLHTKHALIWGAFELLKYENNTTAIHQCSVIGSTQIMVADEVGNYHGKIDYKAKLWETIQTFLAK